MRIEVGQIFRVAWGGVSRKIGDTHASYLELTQGTHRTSADIQKGIWAYKSVTEPSTSFDRIPALVLHSNPFKEGTDVMPWVDIIEPDGGYAIYNGDNRKSGIPPLTARGNDLLGRTQALYTAPALRKLAPPILLFTQRDVGGNRKGYREFSGYGVPVNYTLVTQSEKGSEKHFTNLVVELALFRLDHENEVFDWAWIDRRRDPRVSAADSLSIAPHAWRVWVKEGNTAVERCRRRVARRHVVSPKEQEDTAETDRSILDEIVRFFRPRKHTFEALASLVAARVIGTGCKRGWVTQRSADGGVDFVCRLDVGTEFSRVPIVVLGQAKCQRRVSGNDLARLVARLQRGWIGVFVTTGAFSAAAQAELHQDKYPVMLINGKRLARELRLILRSEGIVLAELLKRETAWYEANVHPVEADRILRDVVFGTPIQAGL